MLSRRNFALGAGGGWLAAGLLPALAQGQTKLINASTFAGISLGCNTGSLRTTVEGAVDALSTLGIGAVELHPSTIEPMLSGRPPFGREPPSEMVRVAQFNRELTRTWRMGVPLDLYVEAGKKFRAAGIAITAYNENYTDDFTDQELERTFDMTLALGTDLISAVGSVAVFRRLDAIARRRKVRIGMHNELNIPNVAAFEAARQGLSDYSGFTLDIGHFTATGGDSMDMLRRHSDRIFNIHIKDRKRNNGPTVAFGDGDTPLVEVLHWVRDNRFKGGVSIEQEAGATDRIQSNRLALEFCRKALLS